MGLERNHQIEPIPHPLGHYYVSNLGTRMDTRPTDVEGIQEVGEEGELRGEPLRN